MLVLSRKRGERVCIAGREIIIEVVEVRGDKVRLGFSCPQDISVHREEVLAAIERRETSEAALAEAAK